VAVAGRVVSREVSYKSKRATYRLHYAFTAADGTEHAGECTVSRAAYDAAAVGDLLTVLYDPRRPRRHLVYEHAAVHALDARGQPVRATAAATLA
jgi:hypothetical protein